MMTLRMMGLGAAFAAALVAALVGGATPASADSFNFQSMQNFDPTSDDGTVAGLGDYLGGNSMSGFCSTCHGNFHSSGASGDYVDNGVSGAFLRHKLGSELAKRSITSDVHASSG